MQKKYVALLLACVLAVGCAVGSTLAYLTASSEAVVNTFTVGSVSITLDETKVYPDGTAVEPTARTTANSYKLVPGKEYLKDPTIHVASNSSDSFVFVRIENGISAIEDEDNSILSQLESNGWVALDGEEDVYYKAAPVKAGQDIPVFGTVTIASSTDLDSITEETAVVVTAYAVQANGFDDAPAAWEAAFSSSSAD